MKTALQFQFLESLNTNSIQSTIYYSTFKMSIDTDVLIIGAGPSGIGMAIQLVHEPGTRNFEIVEKSTGIRGTWLMNSYPGCGCDVCSLYHKIQGNLKFFPTFQTQVPSYSFAPNSNWSWKLALQPEIHRYFVSVANKYDIRPHVRFDSVVKSAE